MPVDGVHRQVSLDANEKRWAFPREYGRLLKRFRRMSPSRITTHIATQTASSHPRNMAIALLIGWLVDYSLRVVELELLHMLSYADALCCAMDSHIRSANSAWRKAGKTDLLFHVDGREPDELDIFETGMAVAAGPASVQVERTYALRLRDLKGTLEGVSLFCGELGIQPQDLLAQFPPMAESLKEAESRTATVTKASGVARDRTAKILKEFWGIT